jgi:hypothetical protein
MKKTDKYVLEYKIKEVYMKAQIAHFLRLYNEMNYKLEI